MMYARRIVWSVEDDAFVATVPEFPGVSALGAAPAEALAELEVALGGAVEALREAGEPIPTPVVHRGFSGQFRLRVPQSLHAGLAERAAAEGVSLNTLAVSLLSAGLGK